MSRYRNNKDGTLSVIAGLGDTSNLANKTDITAIILTGTTNTSGDVISAGTWFYLNGTPCIAKVDIASGATFTEGTNYEEKTIGEELSELNSKIVDTKSSSSGRIDISTNTTYENAYTCAYDGYLLLICRNVGDSVSCDIYSGNGAYITGGSIERSGGSAVVHATTVYVKKGMKIVCLSIQGSTSDIYFSPLDI